MIAKKQNPLKTNRIYFLDNLRTFMIFLVVLYHCGLVYENSGFAGFFWIVHDLSTNNLSSIPNLMVLDIFIMPTIFFIAGFFTPLSMRNKSRREFLASKFKRLLVPWAIAILTLMPLYKVIFLYSRGYTQESWATYFHWSNGGLSQNWLWFLPVLFLFDLLFLAFSKLHISLSRINLKQAIGTAFILAIIYSVSMDFLGAQGWTKTIILDFQNERLLIYFLIFMVGALCHESGIFNEGSTALHSAAFLCRTDIVKMLLENGADKNTTNNAGRTPLESVSGPFDDLKGIYDGLGAALGPLGLKLNYEHLKMTRPKIAEMLK